MAKYSIPLYYQDKTLGDMERMLRSDYLAKSGWLESAESKLATRANHPLPWFTYGAIEFLDRNISSDLSVFEYGGGQSSLWWASRVAGVVTVEHDPAFIEHIEAARPKNAKLILREEDAPFHEADHLGWLGAMPDFPDPARDVRTYRSGQLSRPFRAYAAAPARFERDTFDIVVVDGMARVLSTWVAIRQFSGRGFIVFDNSDRDFYAKAYEMLTESGYRRIDFWGMGPINPYEWCTSVFYRSGAVTSVRWFEEGAGASPNAGEPTSLRGEGTAADGFGARGRNLAERLEAARRAAARPAERCDTLGILLLAFNRPDHLQAVLESLRLQDRLSDCHVWIDGTQGRGEFAGANDRVIAIARRYRVKEVRTHWGHLGIEKLMLDALSAMITRYDRVLILEDDCFPVEGAADAFEAELAAIADRDDIYSVYGHHFGCEPADDRDFSRFQGWGWAAHARQIEKLLPILSELIAMSETDYLAFVAEALTPEVRRRLDVTPGRDVLRVLARGFSWDSATALTTAILDLKHRRTAQRQIHNTGISENIGHFHRDGEHLRRPPLSMIPLSLAWRVYDRTTPACDFAKESYGLDELDLRILESVPVDRGFFVEIGAHDGVNQSNSVILEKRGWRGMLIEANPGTFAKCCRSRPGVIVEHAACVSAARTVSHVTLVDVGLMSVADTSALDGAERETWLDRGEGFARRPRQEIDVAAVPISALFDRHRIEKIDLLILDVEGAEIDVLEGLDFERHAPDWIVAEDLYDEKTATHLEAKGYVVEKTLLERKYTRDKLYRRL